MRRRTFLTVAGALPLFLSGADAARAAKPPVNTGNEKGIGAAGFDVVAYQAGNAVAGSADFSAVHDGVTYRFATADTLKTFQASPERYLPAYGGYCAFAVANGYTADIDPNAFTVIDGRLYLNYSLSVRARWLKDPAGFIAAADANWPGVLDA